MKKDIKIEVPLLSFDVILTFDKEKIKKWESDFDYLAGLTIEFKDRVIMIFINEDFLKKNKYDPLVVLVHEISHSVTYLMNRTHSTCKELRACLTGYLYEKLSPHMK